jgi:hypothetical protein
MLPSDELWSLFRLSDRKQFDNLAIEKVEFLFEAIPEVLRRDWIMWREGFTGWKSFNEFPVILQQIRQGGKIGTQPPPIPQAVLKIADEISEVVEVSRIHNLDGSADEATMTEPTQQSGPSVPVSGVVTIGEPITQIPPARGGVQPPGEKLIFDLQSKTGPGAVAHVAAGGPGTKATQSRNATKPKVIVPARASMQPGQGVRVINLPDEATLSLMLESQVANEDNRAARYRKRFPLRVSHAGRVWESSTIDISMSGMRIRDPLPPGLPRFFNVEIDLGPEGKIPLVCSEVKDDPTAHQGTRLRIQVNDFQNALKSALLQAS